jgi:hypothetical protein
MNCFAELCILYVIMLPHIQTCSPPIGVVVLANKADRIGEEGVSSLIVLYLQYACMLIIVVYAHIYA